MPGAPSERAARIAEALTRHNLPTRASADILREKWKKLLGNVSLGALSAAADLTSADIMAVPEMKAVVLRAVEEAAAVARTCGIALSDDEKHEVLKKITDVSGGGTGSSKSSMAADIARRRRTEIDTIHGAVARLGRSHGVPTPTIDAMIAVVKGLESRYLKPASA
jgi:2-dehydropantoate 2-reductase